MSWAEERGEDIPSTMAVQTVSNTCRQGVTEFSAPDV